MNTEKTVYVIIGGTSGIGAELANQLKSDNTVIHVASRKTGLDINDEQSVYRYFESIGAIDHLVITAGSFAPAGKVTDIDTAAAKAAFDTKFWGTVRTVKHAARFIKQGGIHHPDHRHAVTQSRRRYVCQDRHQCSLGSHH